MKLQLPPGIGIAAATVTVLLGFIGSWKLFARIDPYEALLPGNQTVSTAPAIMTGVELRGMSVGGPLWRIGASSMTISPNRTAIDASGLSDGVFYKNSRPVLQFSADGMHYAYRPYLQDSSIDVYGHVSAETDGRLPQMPAAVRIATDSVKWNGQTSIATCPDVVRFYIQGIGAGTSAGINIDQVRRLVRFGPVYAVSLLATGVTPHPPNLAPSPSSTAPASENDTVKWSASQGGFWDENKHVLTLPGPVTFRQGDAQVNMTGAAYDRNTDTATSSSPVTITDTDTTVTGNEGSINFQSHLAILKGHVIMQVLPKPADNVKPDLTAVKKPTTIECDQVNYDYRAKTARTTGPVTIHQTNRTVTADNGRYDVTAKIVDLDGNVVGTSTDGKVIRAPKAEISVNQDNEWIQVTGPITGEFTVSSQQNPLDDTATTHSK